MSKVETPSFALIGFRPINSDLIDCERYSLLIETFGDQTKGWYAYELVCSTYHEILFETEKFGTPVNSLLFHRKFCEIITEKFGLLAKNVLRAWDINTNEDLQILIEQLCQIRAVHISGTNCSHLWNKLDLEIEKDIQMIW